MTTGSKSGSAVLSQLLAEMNENGNFPISVLTDKEGFPLASAAAAGQDPDKQAALVALIQKTANQVRSQLGMAATDEITMYDANGQRLVCRPFRINSYDLILAVVVPEKSSTYRRLTNSAIHQIRENWKL
jgi:predicted regulator of Ras-like GTPase activity (Roadblock/LC7/MglB family)